MANQMHRSLKSGPGNLARIELKTTPEVKSMFENAAEVMGMSMTAFVVSQCRIAAENALAEQRTTYLNEEAWNRLHELMEAPPQPTDALKELMREKHPNVSIEI